MDSTVVGALVFGVLFGAGLLGVRVRAALPEDHLSAERKDAVKSGMGWDATIAALGLGLLAASTKVEYATPRGLQCISVKCADLLDCNHCHECRPVRAPEWDGDCYANAGRTVSSRRNLLDPGTGHAIRRGDPDFPEAHVQRFNSSRALTM